MSAVFAFPPPPPCPEAEILRSEVRAFLATALAERPPLKRAESWTGHDVGFSRAMGERGWIGMTWPKRYGGQERSALERYVVLEEMLAAGAPVGAHWIADRQSGPPILRVRHARRRSRHPAAHRRRRVLFLHRHERAGHRLRPRLGPHPRGAGRGRLYVVNGTKVWTSRTPSSRTT